MSNKYSFRLNLSGETHLDGDVIFTLLDDGKYHVITTYEDFKYETTSFIKPIGKKGLEVLKEFLQLEETDIDIQIHRENICIKIGHLILDEDILLVLKKEEVSELQLLHRDVTRLRKEVQILQSKIDEFKDNRRKNIQDVISDSKKIIVGFGINGGFFVSDEKLKKILTEYYVDKKFLLSIKYCGTSYKFDERKWMEMNVQEEPLYYLMNVGISIFDGMSLIEWILDTKKYMIMYIYKNMQQQYNNERYSHCWYPIGEGHAANRGSFYIEMIEYDFSEYVITEGYDHDLSKNHKKIYSGTMRTIRQGAERLQHIYYYR